MSGAQVGDKTIMDALAPASESIAAYSGNSEAELFRLAAEAAVKGTEATKKFINSPETVTDEELELAKS